MKTIEEIRAGIINIQDATYPSDPEDASRGDVEGRVRNIWSTAANDYGLDLSNYPEEDSETEYESNAPAIEDLLELGAEIDTGEVQRALDGALGNEIRRKVLLKGIDALAWYVTFHVTGIQWGIYVRASSLLYLAASTFGRLGTDLNTKLQIAFRALHQHELFHFAVDYMSSQVEGIRGTPCHKPARWLRDKETGYIVSEEKLANAHMIRAMRSGRARLRAPGKVEALRCFVRDQPRGYRDCEQVISTQAFHDACGVLVKDYLSCVPGFRMDASRAIDFPHLLGIEKPIDWRYCPIHLVHDEERISVSPIVVGLFQNVRSIQEPPEFIKSIHELHPDIQKQWSQTKNKLACTTALLGLDFKLWRDDPDGQVYSVRLNANYRAHLKYLKVPSIWLATEIGTHKQLGHG